MTISLLENKLGDSTATALPPVTLLIPAYNEENGIGPVLEQVKTIGLPGETLVIDDGSTMVGASPGFYNEALRDYTLTAASPNVNAATLQNPLVSPANDVVMQYQMHRIGVPRVTGGALDVGAYEKH